ncbi:phage tail tape measure protein [Bacillus sp. CGMCC 1.16541]|uniref:phage tail tape measure protein n=1 Tax=Bacillus sp. CGMCC 1.16541 TaxID=2185143 RepID=UPI0013A55B72|nr:phage tail tape measure protein [Bacillus sp. CGMCC 1.16541]
MTQPMQRVIDVLNRTTTAADRLNAALRGANPAAQSAGQGGASQLNQLSNASNNAANSANNLQQQTHQANEELRRQQREAQQAAQRLQDLRQTYGGVSGTMAQSLDRINQASTGLQTSGLAITAAGGAIAFGLGSAVNKAAEFEAQLSSIKAVSGATESQMTQLSALAIEMGAKTKFSATEAARGIEELVKAGVSMTDVVNGGLEGALSLAVAGELELADAAEIASTALNAFKADALSVPQAANILAGAANASATSVGELKFGLAAVASVASGVGLSFNDTTTALAAFAQNGLKGSDAGTSLKTMLMNLSPSTKGAAETMMELGIMAKDGTNKFFDAQGRIKSMAEIAEVLRTSLEKLNPRDRGDALKEMFGTDAIRAGNILFKEGAAGIEAMSAAMSKVTATEVAEEKLNNFRGAVEQLKGAFETAQTSIGTLFLPSLTRLANGVGRIVDAFNSLPAPVQKTMTVIVVAAAALLLFIGPAMILLGFIPSIVSGFTLIAGAVGMTAGAFLGVIGTVLGVIAAIAGIAVVLTLLYSRSETFRNIVHGVFTAVKNVVMQVVETIKQFALGLFKQIQAWWQRDGEMIKQAVMNIVNAIIGAWKAIQPAVSVVMNVLRFILVGVWNNIKSVIQSGVGIIMNVISIFGALFAGNWSKLWSEVKSLLSNALTFAWNLIQLTFLGRILGPIRAGMGFIRAIISAAWNFVRGIFTGSINTVVTIVRTRFTMIQSLINLVMSAVRTVITTAMNVIRGVFSTVLNVIRGNFSAAFNALRSIATSVFNGIRSIIQTVLNAVLTVVRTRLNDVRTFFTNTFNTILSTLSSLPGRFMQFGRSLIQGLWSGIQGAAVGLADKVAGLIDKVVPGPVKKLLGINSPSKLFHQFGMWTMEGMSGGINSGADQVETSATNAAQRLANTSFVAYTKVKSDAEELVPNALQTSASKPNVLPAFGGNKGSKVSNINSQGPSIKNEVNLHVTTEALRDMAEDESIMDKTIDHLMEKLADRLDEVAINYSKVNLGVMAE